MCQQEGSRKEGGIKQETRHRNATFLAGSVRMGVGNGERAESGDGGALRDGSREAIDKAGSIGASETAAAGEARLTTLWGGWHAMACVSANAGAAVHIHPEL